jgi:hypothetical protein
METTCSGSLTTALIGTVELVCLCLCASLSAVQAELRQCIGAVLDEHSRR